MTSDGTVAPVVAPVVAAEVPAAPVPAVPAPGAGLSRLVAGVAVVGAVVLLGGLTASTRVVAASDVPTFVSAVSPGAVLVVGGRERPADKGDRVPDGARLRTSAGPAALTTGERTTRLSAGSTVRVLDGARQQLERGTVLVDARRGDDVAVGVEDVARVEVPSRSLVRLESLPLLRVAAYRGTADVRPAGRRSTTQVTALRQVRVPAGALPGRVTPLALVADDAWERDLLRAVVLDDVELTGLEQELQAQGEPVVRALAVAVAEPTGAAPSRSRAELALAAALASDGTRVREGVLDAVLEGRRLGGSWGVVVRLAGTDARRATDYLAMLMPVQVTQVALDGAAAAGDAVLPLVLPPAAGAPSVTPPPAPPVRRPTSAPAPRPTAPPSPTVPEAPAPVGGVVDTVRDLLPPLLRPPAPAPAPAPARPAPATSPSRAPLLDLEVDLTLLD